MFGLAALSPGPSAACTVTMGGTTYTSIQAAVNVAPMVATLQVDGSTGVCNENVLIPNITLRMIITGMNNATVTGAATSPTIDARVKGVLLANLTINGGSRGIDLRRNANAIFDHLTVQGAAGDGIRADSMALAVVTNSTIQNNGGSGIYIEQLATGRIGDNLPEDGGVVGALSPNTIRNNAVDGITVAYTSFAYIVGNTISGNRANGISVQQSSTAFAADNLINSNGLAGISVSENSSLDLPATFNTASFQTTPNQSTAKNVVYGIYCISGGAVEGHMGSTNPLSGSTSQFGGGAMANTFEATCPSPASSLPVP
jgi:parallel beta-helix repeat protein